MTVPVRGWAPVPVGPTSPEGPTLREIFLDSQTVIDRILKNNSPLWYWVVTTLIIVLLVGYLDWVTGYEMDFFVFYFLPIAVAAWYLDFGGAVCLSVASATVWYVVDVLTAHVYSSLFYDIWNIMIHLISFLIIGWSISQISKLLQNERRLLEKQNALLYNEQLLSDELRKSISEAKMLESFLPICAECKKIRDENGDWQPLESYIGRHTGTKFSHGLCTDCYQKNLDKLNGGPSSL